VPSVLHEMREMCARYYRDRPTVIVEPGVKTGIPIRYDNPKEVGSDRIMNSLAAVHLYGGPAIVVDFGTSTNFDAVSARGEFVGGALAPGIEISVEALARRAAQLLKVELARPPHVIGKSTVEALRSGLLYGFAGQVEGIARRMRAELHPEDPSAVTVIATGGLAPLLIGEVPLIDAHEPWLTLIGLRLVYERNTEDLFGTLWSWQKTIFRSRCGSGSASAKGCLSLAPKRIPSGSSGRRPRRNCAPNTGRCHPIPRPASRLASPGG
jgi:type III pantothenate kinase